MNAVRDWIGKRLMSFAVDHVMSPRTGARFRIFFLRGAGIDPDEKTIRLADGRREPGS